MDLIEYYTEKGVKKSNFVKICDKYFPIGTEALYDEPKFRILKEKYNTPPCASNTPQYQNALRLAIDSLMYDEPICHVENIDENTFTVRPLSYAVRTAFTSFSDVKHMGYTLREIVFPHPFTHNGHFEGINNYPFPKPMGVNVFLIDPENNLILQKRGNLHFDSNMVAATAAGGIEFKIMRKEKDPVGYIIREELEEEINYTGKINGLMYIGYTINYKHLLDISHIFIGWLNEPIEENIKNYEVRQIIKLPLSRFEKMEEVVCKNIPPAQISTNLAAAIDLINKLY